MCKTTDNETEAMHRQLIRNSRRMAAYITDDSARARYLAHIDNARELMDKVASGQLTGVEAGARLMMTLACMHEIETDRTSYFNRSGLDRPVLWERIRHELAADNKGDTVEAERCL